MSVYNYAPNYYGGQGDCSEQTVEDMRAWSQAYGPKRVKTPNMEVEQFDPLTILRAQEREATTIPPFPWGMNIASPNRCKYK